MKRRSALLTLFATLLIGGLALNATAAESAGKRIGTGDIAPDFTLTDHEGRTHTLSAERGKRPVVLVFYRGHW
jgi:cytochrome oxidase Cu insertion factor (SCO1/SenC/PrrC family)